MLMSLVSLCSSGQPAYQAPAQAYHCHGHRSYDCRQDSSHKQDDIYGALLEPIEVVSERLHVPGSFCPCRMLQRICTGVYGL